MKHIRVQNINAAFTEGWWHLKLEGVNEQSRNGPVRVAPGPVMTEYESPCERVLFNPVRDANPVFHLMESLWMLAGYDDIKWLTQFNARIETYAEADGRVHGAYGRRWQHHFGLDQVDLIVQKLKRDPDTRQAVLQMWDPESDLLGNWKDRPCNTTIYFDIRKDEKLGRRLNMTVCCRSNDMLWGAYGANVVHMSILQEAIALTVGVPVGVYRQFSNNFHVYTDLPIVQRYLDVPPGVDYDFYANEITRPLPLLSGDETIYGLIMDSEDLCSGEPFTPRTEFVRTVAKPLAEAYLDRKYCRVWGLGEVADCDWKLAYRQWLSRRGENV